MGVESRGTEGDTSVAVKMFGCDVLPDLIIKCPNSGVLRFWVILGVGWPHF